MCEVINWVFDLRVYLDFDLFVKSFIEDLLSFLSVSCGVFIIIVWNSFGNCCFGFRVSFICWFSILIYDWVCCDGIFFYVGLMVMIFLVN